MVGMPEKLANIAKVFYSAITLEHIPSRYIMIVTMQTGSILSRAFMGTIAVFALVVFAPRAVKAEEATPFQWQRDALFQSLEQEFLLARDRPFEQVSREMAELETEGRALLAAVAQSGTMVLFSVLARLETVQFRMAARAAAHPRLLERLQRFIVAVRTTVTNAARFWPRGNDVRNALYRLLYGGRVAVEEAWIQNRTEVLPELLYVEDAPSATPAVVIEGVRVHSGDILLSRAGAPTSALIARGSDYSGSFSHAALVYVDPENGKLIVIESLIEKGAVRNTFEAYLRDKKRRILLLRPRQEHPVLQPHPDAPHRAAEHMLSQVSKGRIDYDFSMDWQDTSRFFCPEVPYHAYAHVDITLWHYMTTLASPGLRAWMSDMGVRHYTLPLPSDLEYDPFLATVAEWRNADVLKEDRLDNAIMDALLEEADKGLRLGYSSMKVPFGGMTKFWGLFQSVFGADRTIPKGMSVATALRVDSLANKVYPALRTALRQRTEAFRNEKSYEPPYWTLLALARTVLQEQEPGLSPALYRISRTPE